MSHWAFSRFIMAKFFFCLLLCGISQISFADAFGAFDARTMAMGGTAIANSQSGNAGYYNPALLATYNKLKEKSGNSRLSFPLSVRGTNLILDSGNFENRNYDDELTAAINGYNNNPGAATAQNVASVANSISGDLDQVGNRPHIVDLFAGLMIGVPSKYEGGSFYLYSRVIANGQANITAQDRQLLDLYISSLNAVAAGQGIPQNQLFDANNGALLDLTDTLQSNILARAVQITEAGVAISKSYEIGDREYYFGFTPKLQILRAYSFFEDTQNLNQQSTEQSESNKGVNVDLGAAVDWLPQLRVAVVVKNLFPRQTRTPNGISIDMNPVTRLGAQYKGRYYSLAMDLDLYPNQSIGIVDKSHIFSLGGEWVTRNRKLALWGGYRYDFQFADSHSFSLGTRLPIWRSQLDLAYVFGPNETGLALQYSYRF